MGRSASSLCSLSGLPEHLSLPPHITLPQLLYGISHQSVLCSLRFLYPCTAFPPATLPLCALADLHGDKIPLCPASSSLWIILTRHTHALLPIFTEEALLAVSIVFLPVSPPPTTDTANHSTKAHQVTSSPNPMMGFLYLFSICPQPLRSHSPPNVP